ncbi:MAG: hypothetical protein KDJ87_07255 [Rhizobiaceae bacterium]|nr:hypothetical protein [Rhizobiaceae bacterium]
MSKFTGSALALLLVLSLAPAEPASAGERWTHRLAKHPAMRMIDRDTRHHDGRKLRIVSRNVVVVKVDGDSRRHRRHRPADSYSGDVVIDIRNGVGRWSYGSLSERIASADVAPSAKIVDVGTLKAGSACDMQAGVCVIKP